MAKYIVFLRGINVSGKKLIKMEELRKIFEAMGFTNVTTYIQSGNVILDAKEKSSAALNKKIEAGLEKALGFEVKTVVRTPAEMAAVVKSDPFKKHKNLDYKKVYTAFLSAEPAKEIVKAFEYTGSDVQAFLIKGRELFVLYTDGMGNTKFTNNYIEKKLKVDATTRNWNTINKMLELAEAK